MKKILAALAAAAVIFTGSNALAAENPACVLMKFTDDTRFDAIESAESLSDLVMEKLLNSGKFRLMETRPIDENIEIQLYDEKMRDLKYLEEAARNSGGQINLTPLFEGAGFDEKKAQSIATAQLGQIINPEITSAIGAAHNAEYLIQGTIINLGTGSWWSDDFEKISGALNLATAMMNTSLPLGVLGDVLSGVDVGKIGLGVQCDLRIIRADTGEVVWQKRVVGVHQTTNLSLGPVSIGSRKLDNNFYARAMNKAADKIVEALVEDVKAGRPFKD